MTPTDLWSSLEMLQEACELRCSPAERVAASLNCSEGSVGVSIRVATYVLGIRGRACRFGREWSYSMLEAMPDYVFKYELAQLWRHI